MRIARDDGGINCNILMRKSLLVDDGKRTIPQLELELEATLMPYVWLESWKGSWIGKIAVLRFGQIRQRFCSAYKQIVSNFQCFLQSSSSNTKAFIHLQLEIGTLGKRYRSFSYRYHTWLTAPEFLRLEQER